jgi:hypothetical protein
MISTKNQRGKYNLQLSHEEKERVSQILDELRSIFYAESVLLYKDTVSATMKEDYIIKISGCPNCNT